MKVEQIDREAAATIRCALYRADAAMPSYPVGVVEPYLARHRHQARAEVVGEIVAWMKDKASYAWSRESELADQIEAKFGTPNVAD